MICQNCNQEMVLQKKFDTKPRGKMKSTPSKVVHRFSTRLFQEYEPLTIENYTMFKKYAKNLRIFSKAAVVNRDKIVYEARLIENFISK